MMSTRTATDGGTAGPTLTRSDVLATPDWLSDHLRDPGLRVIEVDVSPAAFDQGHIEGAVFWNVYRDLKDPQYRTIGAPALQQLLERSGINADSAVVFYGYAPAMGLWLMKLIGHRKVRILDTNRESWRRAGLPWSTAVDAPTTTSYPLPGPTELIRADQSLVLAAIDDPTCTIVDVRSDLEFIGERFWPSGGMEPGGRAGHVPSAVHLPIDGITDDQGAFRSEPELGRLFGAIEPTANSELITYCTIGGRASTAWFALTYLLGRRNVRVYDGSWAEWGRLTTTPVETGH